MESRLSEIRGANGQVYGISADSPFSLAKWAEQEGYTFDLLSDFSKDVIRAYDVVVPEAPALNLKGLPKRSAFLVDQDGKLVKQELVEVRGAIPDLDGFIDAMKGLA